MTGTTCGGGLQEEGKRNGGLGRKEGGEAELVTEGSGWRQWTKAVDEGSGRRQWTKAVDERSGRRQWTNAVDEGSGRRQWTKAVDERSGSNSTLKWPHLLQRSSSGEKLHHVSHVWHVCFFIDRTSNALFCFWFMRLANTGPRLFLSCFLSLFIDHSPLSPPIFFVCSPHPVHPHTHTPKSPFTLSVHLNLLLPSSHR